MLGWHTTLLPGRGSSSVLLLRIVHVHPRGHPSAPTTNTTTRIVLINIFVQQSLFNVMLENDVYPFTFEVFSDGFLKVHLHFFRRYRAKGFTSVHFHFTWLCLQTINIRISSGSYTYDIVFHLSEDAELQHDATVNIDGLYLSELSLRKIQLFDVALKFIPSYVWCLSFKIGALYRSQ